jgi:PAS domain S-box-containing protein
MKTNQSTTKTSIKDLIHEIFMQSPVPMCITKAEDGTYVEVNESALKYMGLKRKDVIGHSGWEFGFYPKEERGLTIDKIREQGFISNVILERNIPNEGISQMIFCIYPIKIGKKEFFFSYAQAISNNHSPIKQFQDDKFYKIKVIDEKFVKRELKQYNLTPRQQEIALLTISGNSNRNIAKKLYISEHTVKDHMKEIFHTISIHHRSELVPKLLNLR